MKEQNVLPTENEDWGFWGTTKGIVESDKKTKKTWDSAFTIIIEIAGFTPLETLALLDSRWGRHTADEFYTEIQKGTFADVFKKAKTKSQLCKDYNYFVDETAYRVSLNHNELFCKELTKLSKKYGIVIKSVGGVNQNSAGFIRYDDDLDSGDLIPIWAE